MKKNKIELVHGDCLEVMPSIPDGSIDMILADPPCRWDMFV
jgi:site-specific DNA-methyltransferase (adenine-specific)